MKKGKPSVIKDDDTPAGVAIRLVEIFAECLLCIIPHPATIGLGVAAIGDGAQRLASAGEGLDKKNREENRWPNGVPRPIDKSRLPE